MPGESRPKEVVDLTMNEVNMAMDLHSVFHMELVYVCTYICSSILNLADLYIQGTELGTIEIIDCKRKEIVSVVENLSQRHASRYVKISRWASSYHSYFTSILSFLQSQFDSVPTNSECLSPKSQSCLLSTPTSLPAC
jgi:hypothetical protein